MPTIIDSLIVTLSLDPSQFTDGQQKAAQSLRDLEAGAARSVQRVERSGADLVSFFRGLENPLGTLRQQFEKMATVTTTPQRNLMALAQQGRRTGQEIESGALQGAAGMRALGIAGLTAVAAFVALDKVRNSATETARNLFGTSVGAAGAGIPIERFTAISQALLHKGNVPETETQGWLQYIRSAQIHAQQGNADEAAALAANLANIEVHGVNAFTDSPEKILFAIAQRFSSVSSDVAIGLGGMVGQSAALSLALHNLGAAGLSAQIQLEQQRAATDQQSQAARDLTQAQANLDIAWVSLQRRIGEQIDPALTAFDNELAKLLDHLTGPQATKLLTSLGLSVVSPVIGAGYGIYNGIKNLLGGDGGQSSSGAPPSSNARVPSSGDKPNWWQRNAPSWLGGQSGAAPSPAAAPRQGSATPQSFTTVSPGGVGDAMRAAVAESGGNEQTQAAFLAMFNAESGLNPRNIAPPVSGRPGTGGDTGVAQWVGSRKQALYSYAASHGLDPLSKEAQAGYLKQELTTNPQFASMIQRMNAATSAVEAAKIGGFTFEQGGAPAGIFGRGGQSQTFMDNFHSAGANQYLAAIRAAQTGQAAPNTTSTSTTHATTNDIDVGDVHVHGANTGDGYKLGGEISSAIASSIHSQILVNTFNTSQE